MSESFLESSSEARATGMVQSFQCLLFSTLATDESPSFLLAASRSRVFVFSVQNGNLLSTWQSNQSQSEDLQSKQPKADGVGKEELAERPTKRRKKEGSSDNESEGSSAEIVTEAGRPRGRKPSRPIVTESNVIKLAVTSDGRVVVAVTDEDKSVRVLSLDFQGRLQQLSQRQDG